MSKAGVTMSDWEGLAWGWKKIDYRLLLLHYNIQ
jgi:hypothetical protein